MRNCPTAKQAAEPTASRIATAGDPVGRHEAATWPASARAASRSGSTMKRVQISRGRRVRRHAAGWLIVASSVVGGAGRHPGKAAIRMTPVARPSAAPVVIGYLDWRRSVAGSLDPDDLAGGRRVSAGSW